MRGRKAQRRGVLLLVVLSLLVLFVLAGTTYVATSGQYRRSTANVVQAERSGSNEVGDLDDAVFQIIRGPTSNSNSVLGFHCLLRDFYGDEHLNANGTAIHARVKKVGVGSTTPPMQAPPKDVLVLKIDDPDVHFDPTYDDYYTSCVLTMTSGKLRGRSTRVLRYFVSGYPNDSEYMATEKVFVVERFENATEEPAAGDTFFVNGRPFNGVGAGFDATTGILDTTVLFNPRYKSGTPPNAGGMDEPYDAPDLNNLFLGWQPSTLTYSSEMIPSYHRPGAANYLAASRGETDFSTVDTSMYTAADRAQWRDVLLRPTKIDHPQFTGSNLLGHNHPFGFDPINGPWDIDNDGDGVADSVWIDLGLPNVETPEGRIYKPLFAVLCLDLDGRVNINAAGSLEMLDTVHLQTDISHGATIDLQPLFSQLPLGPGDPNRIAGDGRNGLTQLQANSRIARGHGVGPAELSLVPSLLSLTEAENLLRERYKSAASNEFDTLGVPGLDPYKPNLPPGMITDDDFNFQQKNRDIALADAYSDPDGVRGLPTLSPVDSLGLGFVALTQDSGQPLMVLMDPDYDLGQLQFTDSNGNTQQLLQGSDDPYELNLVSPQSWDSLFTEIDLEPLLRWVDHDVADLSPRLANLVTPDQVRSLITTRSFEVPVPSFQYPGYRRQGATPLSPPETVFDFYEGMLGIGALTQDDVDQLIPREFQRGEKFNVNRLLNLSESFPFDTRQEYARHLYVLGMFLREFTAIGGNGLPDNNVTNNRIARETAQWAINVVDFFDADSVMTPFEYDEYPFDGWDVDGKIAYPGPDNLPGTEDDVMSPDDTHSQRELVWGCERPELLITETLAWHDRRTEDLAFAGGNMTMSNGDPTLDQRLMPRGALFIELFNPWNSPSEERPAELYGASGVTLDLTWRINLTNLPENITTNNVRERDRQIYFTPNAGLSPKDEYRPSNTAVPTPPEIDPGSFAVIGTGELDSGGGRATPMGFSSSANFPPPDLSDSSNDPAPAIPTDITDTRRVQMGSNMAGLLQNGHHAEINVLYSEIAESTSQNCVTIPIRDLSVSEPRLNWQSGRRYDGLGRKPKPAGVDGQLEYQSPPVDTPFDEARTDLAAGAQAAFQTTQTVPSYATAELQRLANPNQPHDNIANPYITVDRMDIDLTIFNGVTSSDNNLAGNNVWFYSRQRGDSFWAGGDPANLDVQDLPYRTLWRQQPSSVPLPLPATTQSNQQATQTAIDNSATARVNANSKFENSPLEAGLNGLAVASHVFNFASRASLGSIGHRFELPANLGAGLQPEDEWSPQGGQPRDEPAFPWLTWHNRPFHNPYELLLVPKTSASELLAGFGFIARDFERENTNEFQFFNPDPGYTLYQTDPDQTGPIGAGVGGGGSQPLPVTFVPFGHLYNFHQNNDQLDRLLDFMQTPPRFMGTEKWFTDNNFQSADAMSLYSDQLTGTPTYASRFRNPGKININTINDGRVWESISRGANGGPIWDSVVQAMRSTSLDSSIPVAFHSPFRPAAGADLLADALGRDAFSSGSGLLRRSAIGSTQPLFMTETDEGYHDSLRNPYFYYLPTMRLSNLVSNQSNVFAIWMTVGYFELETWTTHPNDTDRLDGNPETVAAYARPEDGGQPDRDVAHPDGLMLGAELGSDTGEITRHRAFYIIDRSIPVGFEPGQDHNVEDTIILRRFIE